ncbi:jg26981 [Pararge aegeria aegeria]|uniref:Jg26981 protein n=1 Tax=Pararge aegeria aegeria TaxID=348720 RepID=A0A8S4RWZ2_9NEOP|nr:jg26981 [Pararge aegeria aegeria]
MRSVLIAFIVTFAFAVVAAQNFPTKSCPPGEHSVLYCPQMAEPTCSNPSVHKLNRPSACGIPQCFCDNPYVRDRYGRCVPLTEC